MSSLTIALRSSGCSKSGRSITGRPSAQRDLFGPSSTLTEHPFNAFSKWSYFPSRLSSDGMLGIFTAFLNAQRHLRLRLSLYWPGSLRTPGQHMAEQAAQLLRPTETGVYDFERRVIHPSRSDITNLPGPGHPFKTGLLRFCDCLSCPRRDRDINVVSGPIEPVIISAFRCPVMHVHVF